MKIIKNAKRCLVDGDSITVSVSHEVKIGRESTWVRYEATSHLLDDEPEDQARDRVIEHVDDAVMTAIHKVVETVQGSSR